MAEYTLLLIELGVHAVVIKTTEVAPQILKQMYAVSAQVSMCYVSVIPD
jgi:hypothetical protein